MKNKQLYIAYGSNINLKQMAYRCPHSKVVGTSEIKDYELEFRGVATIVPSKGTSVPVLIWELDERDLPTLNRYEGYPRLYRQEKMSFDLDGKEVLGMAYLMNYGELSPPSQQYYNTILQGYRENGLDEKYLQTALENSLFLEHSGKPCFPSCLFLILQGGRNKDCHMLCHISGNLQRVFHSFQTVPHHLICRFCSVIHTYLTS